MSKHEVAVRSHLNPALLEVGDSKAMTNPIGSLLPREVRLTVNKLWVCYSHLIPSALALASNLRVWMDEHGLQLDEVEKICKRMMSPEMQSRNKFASDLISGLAYFAAEVVKQRRSQEAREERERDHESASVQAVSVASTLARLREQIGRGFEDEGESA